MALAGGWTADADQRLAALSSTYGSHIHLYHERLTAMLRMRSGDLLNLKGPAQALGRCFPLMGYRQLVNQLVKLLQCMITDSRLHRDPSMPADYYKRQTHILQLSGPPGLGKTTAAQMLWPALRQLCLSNAWPAADAEVAADVRERVLASFSPQRALFFQLDLSQDNLGTLHPEEQELLDAGDAGWDTILALRLLYAMLRHEAGSTYSTFLHTLSSQQRQNLRMLQPLDCVRFAKREAGLPDDQHCMMVFFMDELNAAATPARLGNWVPQLLAAFVRLRLAAPHHTLPICIVASTIWSRSNLTETSSGHARVVDLPLLPLTSRHCAYIMTNVFSRLQLAQAQQLGLLQQLRQQQLPAQQQQQEGDDEWQAAINLQPSDELPDPPAFPQACQKLLRLVGGNPRIMSYALAAMSGGTNIIVHTDQLLDWMDPARQDQVHLQDSVSLLIDAVKDDQRWRTFAGAEGTGKLPLLVQAIARSITLLPVQRDALVAPEWTITWDQLQQDGVVTLLTQRSELRSDSRADDTEDPEPPNTRAPVYVHVAPLLLAAFGTAAEPALMYMRTLNAKGGWRDREQQDMAVIALRAVMARNVLGYETLSIGQLIGGPAATDTGLLATQVQVPKKVQLERMKSQLATFAFDARVQFRLAFPGKNAWAYIGPRNYKADSWLILRTDSGKPFVIYISSKQRAAPEGVSLQSIVTEMKKDVISTKQDYVYVYVTDQHLTPRPRRSSVADAQLADMHLVVITEAAHVAFYGSIVHLLDCIKE